ncbi:MAG: hypothetical protein M0C28_26945 [Candidatus Moduliflexus flocculans]|nr:hypothetical protein [Candidatus Moduliflexus flocculans]
MDPADPETLYAAAVRPLPPALDLRHRRPGLAASTRRPTAARPGRSSTAGLPGGILGRIGLAVYPKNPQDPLRRRSRTPTSPACPAPTASKEILEGKSERGHDRRRGLPLRRRRGDLDQGQPGEAARSAASPATTTARSSSTPTTPNIVYVLSVGVLASPATAARPGPRRSASAATTTPCGSIPRTSRHMLLGYDHGLGVTWDGGKNWYHPDYLPLAQFYAVDFDMSWPYRVAGGLQDNGILMGPSTKVGGGGYGGSGGASGPPIRLEDWFNRRRRRRHVQRLRPGDQPLRSTTSPSSARWPASTSRPAKSKSIAYQRRSRRRAGTGAPRSSSRPTTATTVYHCGNIVVMSTNRGETWTEISPDLSTNDPAKLTVEGKGGDGNIQYCTITTFDESPLVPGLLWAGTDDGNVWVTRDNGKAWTKLNDKIPGQPGLLGQPGRGVALDPGTAYVSLHGLPQRRLPALPLQDDRLRRHLDLARGRPGRRARSTSSARTPRTRTCSSPARTSASTSRSTAARPG